MSVVRGFGLNGKSFYTNISKPQQVNLAFTVNATDTGGLGVTSVKSNGYVNNVFMHTSATPGANNGMTNPNPQSGYAWVQFTNNFNYYLSGNASFQTGTTGSIKIDNSAMTAGNVYVITTLGDATAAKWLAIGVPPGVTPAVGVSFVALSNGGSVNTSTSRVSTPVASGISHVEVVGNPQLSLANSSIASNGGAWVLLEFLGASLTMNSYTPAGTNSAPALTMNSYTPAGVITNGTPDTFAGTPAVLTGSVAAPVFTGTPATLTGSVSYVATAPASGTVVSLKFLMDGSSVTIDGL